MDSTIDFFQIYYRDEQIKELYDFAIPYKNLTLTPYFENSVICELVPKSKADKISICSWRLREKRGQSFRSNKPLNLEGEYDIAILTPRSPSHKPLTMARQWHGMAWEKGLQELKKFIKIPTELNYAIYENHFVARKDIYQSYVNECLLPCIDFMSARSVFFDDSGYARNKPEKEVQQYKNLTGRNDWPICVFLLERLFSIWIHNKNFKIVNR